MRILAGTLLILTALLQLTSGALLGTFGVMGMTLMMMLGSAGAELPPDATQALMGLALGVRLLGPIIFVVAGALAFSGVFVFIAGVQVMRRSATRLAHIGCVLATVFELLSLALFGFYPLQLLGLLAGLLGLASLYGMATTESSRQAGPAGPTGALAAGGVVFIGVGLVASAALGEQVRDVLFGAITGNPAALSGEPVRTNAGSARIVVGPRPATPAAPPTPALRLPTVTGDPVSGKVAGVNFRAVRVALVREIWTTTGQNGSERIVKPALLIEGGEALSVKLSNFAGQPDLQSGFALSVDPSQSFADSPTLSLTTPSQSSSFGNTDTHMQGYALELKLEPLADNRVAGTIALSAPAGAGRQGPATTVAGTFSAWMDGFTDIEPDLSRGARVSFPYLGFQHVRATYPDRAVALVDDAYRSQIGDPHKRVLNGVYRAVYTLDGVEHAFQWRMQGADGRWAILDALSPNQLDVAHPVEVPDGKRVNRLLSYLGALQAEAWIEQQHADAVVWYSGARAQWSRKSEVAMVSVEVRFRGEADKRTQRYLFRKSADGGWTFDRPLRDNEKYDRKTGQVTAVD
ncbi:MAG: hypothetical protein AAF458_20195 [Pseudomonadota bacterium]